jgi:hypothetical protein
MQTELVQWKHGLLRIVAITLDTPHLQMPAKSVLAVGTGARDNLAQRISWQNYRTSFGLVSLNLGLPCDGDGG